MRAVSQQRLTVNIIKWALFGAVMILLFVMLARSAGAISTADITTIQTNVSEAADKEKMKKGDNRMLRRLYGIDPEQLESFVLYYPSSNMGAEELLFVRVKEQADVSAVKALIEQRNASQIQAFEGYGVQQTGLLKEAVIKEYGRDIIYAVGDKNKAVTGVYEST